jgi:predicted GNAT family N-acyltransferase
MNFEKIVFQSTSYFQALALRDDILRAPLGLFFTPEDIQMEKDHHHFGLFTGEALYATAQLVEIENNAYKMRQVAVNSALQGLGLGTLLVNKIEQWAIKQHAVKIALHARETAVPFYLKHHYQIFGERFQEVGIPHFKMVKILSS